jgi:cobalt-zinc-cadmium efflux system outer membrane protein
LRLAAAESSLASTRALAKRDVTVGLQFEHYPTAGDLPPNNTWGVSVSIPLFAAHAYEGEILRGNADLDQARDLLARTRANAIAEIQRAISDLRSSQDRLARLETLLLPEAEKVASAAEFAYRKGATGLLELLDARRTLRQAQFDALTARGDFAKAIIAMKLQVSPAGSQ